MIVADLIAHLQAQDQDASVEFHDVTTGRDCPVNTVRHGVKRSGGPVVVLSNRLGASDPRGAGYGKSELGEEVTRLFG